MLEALNYDSYDMYQILLSDLEQETGLSFENSLENVDLKDFDANVIAEGREDLVDKPLTEDDLA